MSVESRTADPITEAVTDSNIVISVEVRACQSREADGVNSGVCAWQ